MKEKLAPYAKPFALLYILAIVVMILARIGIAVMDATGILSYSYWSATSPYIAAGSLMDQLCWALTGGTLVGFMFAAGLAFAITAAAVVILAAKARETKADSPTMTANALVWGMITAIVAFAGLMATIAGLFSGVQIAQMSGKSGGSTGIVLLLLVIELGTLIAAAGSILASCACREEALVPSLLRTGLIALVCGAIVCALTVGTFATLNQAEVSTGAAFAWLVGGIVANVAMTAFGAKRLG